MSGLLLYISTLLNVRLLSDGGHLADVVGMWLYGPTICVTSLPIFVVVPIYKIGTEAGFDVTVTSPLTPVTLNEASVSVGTAAHAAEIRKHAANDIRCQDLGWTCVPLAIKTYGNWGKEAHCVFSRLASLLSISQSISKPQIVNEIYSHLNMSLVRSIVARAIMERECWSMGNLMSCF
ncbi:hypothetical protein EMCRGX_G032398 [Ephydatia muelleri]